MKGESKNKNTKVNQWHLIQSWEKQRGRQSFLITRRDEIPIVPVSRRAQFITQPNKGVARAALYCVRVPRA